MKISTRLQIIFKLLKIKHLQKFYFIKNNFKTIQKSF